MMMGAPGQFQFALLLWARTRTNYTQYSPVVRGEAALSPPPPQSQAVLITAGRPCSHT